MHNTDRRCLCFFECVLFTQKLVLEIEIFCDDTCWLNITCEKYMLVSKYIQPCHVPLKYCTQVFDTAYFLIVIRTIGYTQSWFNRNSNDYICTVPHMHKLHLLVAGSYDFAFFRIFQVVLYLVLLSFNSQMCLLSSVLDFLLLFLNEHL